MRFEASKNASKAGRSTVLALYITQTLLGETWARIWETSRLALSQEEEITTNWPFNSIIFAAFKCLGPSKRGLVSKKSCGDWTGNDSCALRLFCPKWRSILRCRRKYKLEVGKRRPLKAEKGQKLGGTSGTIPGITSRDDPWADWAAKCRIKFCSSRILCRYIFVA